MSIPSHLNSPPLKPLAFDLNDEDTSAFSLDSHVIQKKRLADLTETVSGFFETVFHYTELHQVQIGWHEKEDGLCYIKGEKQHCLFTFVEEDENLQPEVVAHAYTHGILKKHCPLNSTAESKALNESICDLFGIAFKHWYGLKDWKIYNRDIGQETDYSALKLLDPHEFPSEKNGYGYCHSNSLIPSYAFYKAVQATKSKPFGRVAQVWFQSLVNANKEYATFASFAKKTIQVASEIDFEIAPIISWVWGYVKIAPEWSFSSTPTSTSSSKHSPDRKDSPVGKQKKPSGRFRTITSSELPTLIINSNTTANSNDEQKNHLHSTSIYYYNNGQLPPVLLSKKPLSRNASAGNISTIKTPFPSIHSRSNSVQQ